jgi:energy-coupling factor transporter ATP-binding protein EcfA2
MRISPESPESIQESLAYLRAHEDDYESNKDVRLSISEKSLTAIIGPTGAGKSTLTEKVKELNPDIFEVGSTVTRKLRDTDPKGFVSVTYAEFRAMAERGDFVNYNVVDQRVYGTQVSGLPGDLNIGPILTKSVDTLMNAGLRRFNVGYIVLDGDTYEQQLEESRLTFDDFKPRAKEGHESIQFARDNVSSEWLHFVENSHDEAGFNKAARKIIAITRGIYDTDTGGIMTRERALAYLDEMDEALYRVEKKAA